MPVTVDNGTLTDYSVSTRTIGADEVQAVDPRPKLSRIVLNSAGLTIATTAYSVGDQLGTILTFASAVRDTAGLGVIRAATLLDKADIVIAVDLHLFRATVTLAADNAAFAVSDTDMENWLGSIQFPAAEDLGANRAALATPGLAFDCADTSLFGALVTKSTHTFFGAVTDLRVALIVEQV